MDEKCIFCRRHVKYTPDLGRLYVKKKSKIAAHYHCLVFSEKLVQADQEQKGIKGFSLAAIKEVANKEQKCVYCGEGCANVKCAHSEGCSRYFHLPCGLEGGAVLQFYDQFLSYCTKHRPYQQLPLSAVMPDSCHICLQGWTDLRPTVVKLQTFDHCTVLSRNDDILWAPCCKYTAAFHRHCVKRMAEVSGYFFRCPCCNNSETFSREMKRLGIHVPLEDPCWELERRAYEELSQAPKMECSVSGSCPCPHGPTYHRKGSPWEMLKCCLCAAEGIHSSCGKVSASCYHNWQCPSCTLVVNPGAAPSTPLPPMKPKPAAKRPKAETSKTSTYVEPACKKVSRDCTPPRSSMILSFDLGSMEGQQRVMDLMSNNDQNRLHDILTTTVFKVNDTGVYEIVNDKYGYREVLGSSNS